MAAWSGGLPAELSAAFHRMRWDGTIPAFSGCSLDNNPGNGDPADGDYYGAINAWLLWDDADAVDEKDRWEETIWLIPSCPEDRCTVDITPRHCRLFKPKPGDKFRWTSTSLADNKPSGGGELAADKHGLLTIPQAVVTKGRSRIRIERR